MPKSPLRERLATEVCSQLYPEIRKPFPGRAGFLTGVKVVLFYVTYCFVSLK